MRVVIVGTILFVSQLVGGCANNQPPDTAWLKDCMDSKKRSFFRDWETSDEVFKNECVNDQEGRVQLAKDENPLIAIYDSSYSFDGVEYDDIVSIGEALRARKVMSAELIWPRNYVDSSTLKKASDKLKQEGISNIYVREISYPPGEKIPLEYFKCAESPTSKDVCVEATAIALALEDELPRMVNSSTYWRTIKPIGGLIELTFQVTYDRETLVSRYGDVGLSLKDAEEALLNHKDTLCRKGTPTREFVEEGGRIKYKVIYSDKEPFSEFVVSNC